MANRLAQDITKALTGDLGDFIATATVKKNCELIGTTPDSLTQDQLPVLLEKLEKSVSFFTDKNTAKVVLEKIRMLEC